jgi:hypothetical protein
MWDPVESMRLEDLLSQSTFASSFASSVNVGRIVDVFITFEVIVVLGICCFIEFIVE